MNFKVAKPKFRDHVLLEEKHLCCVQDMGCSVHLVSKFSKNLQK